MKEVRTDMRFLILMYALAFILLWEWLLPVIELTDTEYITVFLFFIGISFIFGLLRMKWWLSIPLKLIYLFWSLHYVFFETVILSRETVSLLITDLLSNIGIIAAWNWDGITNPFRTVLFFVLLWMTIYLIRHWIEVRKSILLFYALTVIFIAILDTFSSYSAEGAIFRIMVSGLLLIGLLTISRISDKHGRKIGTGMFAAFSLPLLFAVVCSSAFASIMPDRGPAWDDPIPFLKSVVQGEGIGSGSFVAKSGYDTDDSKLGGAFSQDSTVVFSATVPKKQYWKIETKNTYTSKGWEQRSEEAIPVNIEPGSLLAFSGADNLLEEDKFLHAEINMKEQLPFLVYPYGTSKIHTRTDVVLQNQEDNGRFWVLKDGEEAELDSFGIDLIERNYSLKALRATSMDDYALESMDFSEYLQLPEQLPARVRELALTITGKEESVYEKAKSIERYFARNGFMYDQQNVAVPRGAEDYVDQFLFDTKRGYCDNFSTSMVVMLRASDIPARWVKGFAPGEGKTNSEGKMEYQVTNNEAHSWVEAYIPGFGWMPFEPTIGFSNMTGIEYDLELDMSDPEAPDMEEREKPETNKETPVKKDEDNGVLAFFNKMDKFLRENAWIGIAVLAVIVFIAWQVYKHRGKWIPKLLINAYRKRQADWVTYTKQYKGLLKQLDRFGFKRTDSMTLSEYAKTVDTHFGGRRMKMLTEAYERGLYGGYTRHDDWAGLQEIWEDLINRASC
ncbi:transglutaminaseTgpA domain-containing protein [Sporosarcina luteola]|uniref:transglutaminaseTgpA domain-containing protein n=1 Tax=Sporosarcina luteola TaxID=582850 RepID=UPI00203F22CD|nr:transglutaminaseTgpA domain-containing protein [Sporosarcina luteola]MCM3745270.1 transglutaminaseTgpA domain-containing protein [Sporosarcina luteola]